MSFVTFPSVKSFINGLVYGTQKSNFYHQQTSKSHFSTFLFQQAPACKDRLGQGAPAPSREADFTCFVITLPTWENPPFIILSFSRRRRVPLSPFCRSPDAGEHHFRHFIVLPTWESPPFSILSFSRCGRATLSPIYRSPDTGEQPTSSRPFVGRDTGHAIPLRLLLYSLNAISPLAEC
jgi:hypothetical protein